MAHYQFPKRDPMGWPQRSRILFLVVSYLALLIAPFFPLLKGQAMPLGWTMLGTEALLWALVWALFGRPLYFHWLLLPAFLALPLELYLQLFFGQGLSAHHLGIMAETTSAEALEFLGGRVWLMAAILLAVAAWWVLCFAAARNVAGLAWRGKTRWAFLALAGSMAAVSAYGFEFGVAGEEQRGARLLGLDDMPSLPPSVSMPSDARIAGTWPFGLLATVADYYKERTELARLTNEAQGFTFQARQQEPDGEPETVVVVIGESSRFDRWRLNGYARDTNPLLAREDNLVILSDVVTPVTVTRLSVPILMTRKPARAAKSPSFHEKSFVTAYREAGFRTWWLSNQLTYGEHDTSFAVYSQEADEVKHLNPGGFYEQSSYDGALLEPLQRALSAPAQRKLVVLHTLGSHWNYARRHPPEFNRWQPSLTGVDWPQLGDQALVQHADNSYDNSILYTDWFLAQAIGLLKQKGERAVLLYVADHGETMGEGQCPLYLHGHRTENEFHVPALLWYSDRYRARYPVKVASLESHRAARLGTQDVFHTVMDLGDLRYPGQRLQWSFAQADYTSRPRIVASDDWVDYDLAERRGPCQVLFQPAAAK